MDKLKLEEPELAPESKLSVLISHEGGPIRHVD